MEDKAMTKVKDLTPASKQVNVLVKVVSLSEEREITSKFGEARKLVEATVGDETGSSSSGPSAATAVAAVAAAGATETDGTAGDAGTDSPSPFPWPLGQDFSFFWLSSGSAARFEVSDPHRSARVRSTASWRPSAFGPFRHLINPLGLANREPAVPEGARVFFRHLDVEHIELRLHEVPELRSLRLVLFVPHPRELLVLVVGHRRHRLNAR